MAFSVHMCLYATVAFDLWCLASFNTYSEGGIQDTYIGCFYDASNQSSLTRRSLQSSAKLTIEMCIEQCRSLNTTYAGLQGSEACLCGNNFGVSLPDTSCNALCPGDQSQYCGGSNGQRVFYSLYAVCEFGYYGYLCDQVCHCRRQAPCDRMTGKCPNGCEEKWFGTACNEIYLSEKYIGCFWDSADRAFPSPPVKDDRMTVEFCSDNCISLYNSYAGLQYSKECYCGETYARYGLRNESDCNMICSGNASQFCGGPWANSVYSVCPAGYYGPKCGNQCHCNNSRCAYLTGECNSTCKTGWSGTSCNIRDCTNLGGDCFHNETCATIDLKFASVTRCRCLPGFGITSSWDMCLDIDECELGLCNDLTSDCANTIGGYRCSCKPGYRQYNETTCFDVDECMTITNSCNNSTEDCINTDGSYFCSCKSGFQGNPGTPCFDINECSMAVCDDLSTNCTNKIGGFECQCRLGYEPYSKTTCIPSDPCNGFREFSSHFCNQQVVPVVVAIGAAVGSALGSAFLVIIIVIGIFLWRRRQQRKRNTEDSSENRRAAPQDVHLDNVVSNMTYETLQTRQTQDDSLYTDLTNTELQKNRKIETENDKNIFE